MEEGIKLEVVTGFGADKVMASVLSGESDIGFMGSESSIYAYQQGANDPVINFAQLTQRAGNFIVAREEMPDFQWTDLVGKDVLGGRKSGMPEMVFEYILKQKGIDPDQDLNIDRSIDFGSTARLSQEGRESSVWNLNLLPQPWNRKGPDMWWLPAAWNPAMCLTLLIAPRKAI